MNAEPIFQALLGYRQAAVVRAAIELDCFTWIDRGRSTPLSIAAAAGGTERSIRILLDAVAATTPQILRKRGGAYRLTPLSRRYLVRSRPGYLGPLMPLYGHPRMWDAFRGLARAVRAGRSVLAEDAHSPGQEFWEVFARATAEEARTKAGRMVSLAGRPPVPCEILDLACGSGMYGATFARRIRGSRLTLFDQPHVLAHTRKIVRTAARFLAGDLFRTPLGGPYDLVIASHVLHHFSPAECVRLLGRVARAMRPGGRLVIQEFVPDEGRRTKVQALVFAVTMLVWTRRGDAYLESQYRRWLGEAGFTDVRFHPQPEPGDVIVATRAPGATSSRA